MDTTICGNCETPLTGPYCSQCGQHAHESSRSIGALFHDAWHVVTHVDGRFWQTIAALLWRPGRLTREYFADHRARYLPPVRLYLVLSVLLFAVAATGSHSASSLSDTLDAPAAKRNAETADGVAAAVVAAAKPVNKGTEEDKDEDALDAAKVRSDVQQAIKEAQASGAPLIASNDGSGLKMNTMNCETMNSDWKFLQDTIRDVCRRNVGDHFKSLVGAFVASIPKMMFVFVPLMAFVMMLMYWWPRHYYVEHLVFFIHLHAAVFLIFLIELLLSRLGQVIPVLAHIGTWDKGFGFLYALWYVFRAMRVFYGQGRALTLLKMLVLALCYSIFLAVTMAATFMVVALLT